MVGSPAASPERKRPATVEPTASPQQQHGLSTSRSVANEKSSDLDLPPADTAGWSKGVFTPRTLEACKREGILPQDLQYWKPERFRAVGVSAQRQQMRYAHRERLRQENVQTVVAARSDLHRNPPLKLDPSQFRVKKGLSKEIEEQMAAEKKRMEIAEAKQREEIAQIAQAEIAKVKMMNKVTAKLEALAVKERERKKEAAAKQAAWEQEQARIARDRHMKETDELKAAEALAAQRYKEDQAKLAKEEAEKKKRLEEQKARDAAIEEKRKELERLRAAEEAEEQRKITEKLEQLALKEAKVKESIEVKREQIKEEARQKQQKTEARLKATQSFFQQQADEAKAMFDMKMKENEKKRLEFEKRREEEVASRREKAERKAQELVEVQKRLEEAEMLRVAELNVREQAMLQRMETRERDRLADEERRHQLELEEQRKRKAILESTRELEALRMRELEKRQAETEKHMAIKRAEKQQISEQQAEEARLQLEEKLERCNRLKRMDDYQRQQQGIKVEQDKLRYELQQKQKKEFEIAKIVLRQRMENQRMAMMEKIERIKQHASVEELQAMLLQTEKSSESRSSSPPKRNDKADADTPGIVSGMSAVGKRPGTSQGVVTAKKGKGKVGSGGSKAKLLPLPVRSVSVPLEAAGGSALVGGKDRAGAAAAAAAACGGDGGDNVGVGDGDDGIAFISDGKFEQRPTTSACKSRVGIRERKALPLPPSHFQAQDTEFGDAIAAVLPVGNAVPVGKRQKTSAAAAIKKPGVNGLLEDKAIRPQDVLRLSMYLTKETRKAAAKEVLARKSPPRQAAAAVELIRRDRDVNFAPEIRNDIEYEEDFEED